MLSCSVSGAPAQSKMDERPILTGQGRQDQDAMDLAPDRDLLWESYLDPGHRGPRLLETQSADIDKILSDLSSRDEVYNERVLRSVLLSGNAQNAELNTVKSSFNEMSSRMQQLELTQRLAQVEHLNLAESAKKREKSLRLEVFKGVDAKREFAALVDLEHIVQDGDKVLESLFAKNLDSLLKGQKDVPMSGYVEQVDHTLLNKVMGGLVASHLRVRTRLMDQIRVLEAAAKSSLGKDIIPKLQPTWDHFSAGSLEEKEAFDERVKAAEKSVRADRTALNAQRLKSRKGAQGSGGSASLAATLARPLKSGSQGAAGGGGGKSTGKPKKKKKRLPRCHKCKARGHTVNQCKA